MLSPTPRGELGLTDSFRDITKYLLDPDSLLHSRKGQSAVIFIT